MWRSPKTTQLPPKSQRVVHPESSPFTSPTHSSPYFSNVSSRGNGVFLAHENAHASTKSPAGTAAQLDLGALLQTSPSSSRVVGSKQSGATTRHVVSAGSIPRERGFPQPGLPISPTTVSRSWRNRVRHGWNLWWSGGGGGESSRSSKKTEEPPVPTVNWTASASSFATEGHTSSSASSQWSEDRTSLIQRVLLAFQTGQKDFGDEEVEAWVQMREKRRRNRSRKAEEGQTARLKMTTGGSWLPPAEAPAFDDEPEAAADELDELRSTLWAALETNREVLKAERGKFDDLGRKLKRRHLMISDIFLPSAPPEIEKLKRIHRHQKASSASAVTVHRHVVPVIAPSKTEVEGIGAASPKAPKLSLCLPPRRPIFDFSEIGYEFVDFLAQGSLGVLCLVRKQQHSCSLESSTQLWVAKVIDLNSFATQFEATQALLEAELLRRLNHPNIVSYKESFISHNSLVIIMEYCECGDLHSLLSKYKRKNQTVPENLVVKWTKELALGLQYMHDRKILHCDLKSSNIFIDRQFIAKVGDLGIARELKFDADCLSPSRCPRGTPVYMSPEMCKKAALTESSDCWSLGCILYELCHLSHAFKSQLSFEERWSTGRDNGSSAGSATSSAARSSLFVPGVSARSDLSMVCRSMLQNIASDLQRLKTKAAQHRRTSEVEFRLPAELLDVLSGTGGVKKNTSQSYWLDEQQNVLQFPQILPYKYSPLMNYTVCVMLEPKPSLRPALQQVIAILELLENRLSPLVESEYLDILDS